MYQQAGQQLREVEWNDKTPFCWQSVAWPYHTGKPHLTQVDSVTQYDCIGTFQSFPEMREVADDNWRKAWYDADQQNVERTPGPASTRPFAGTCTPPRWLRQAYINKGNVFMTHPDMCPVTQTEFADMRSSFPNEWRDKALKSVLDEYTSCDPQKQRIAKGQQILANMQKQSALAYVNLLDYCDQEEWNGYITKAIGVETFWYSGECHAGVWTHSSSSGKPTWKTLEQYIEFVETKANRQHRKLNKKRTGGEQPQVPLSPFDD